MLTQTILIVDDDQDITRILEHHLLDEGYTVFKASNGPEALALLSGQKIDLVILDIMLPGIDGLEICRRIRETLHLPIILLSARSSDLDKVLGLSIGADDYMVKPFTPIELIARVKAQLRRATYFNQAGTAQAPADLIKLHGLEIHETSRQVSLYGTPLKLTKTEYDILILLAKNPNRVFSLEEIFEQVWKEKYYNSNNTVMVHMARLREKLGDNTAHTRIIQNVWGVGYKIEK
jgi:DNA-binding response OmpR family regulator